MVRRTAEHFSTTRPTPGTGLRHSSRCTRPDLLYIPFIFMTPAATSSTTKPNPPIALIQVNRTNSSWEGEAIVAVHRRWFITTTWWLIQTAVFPFPQTFLSDG